jgi:hypothetical protein
MFRANKNRALRVVWQSVVVALSASLLAISLHAQVTTGTIFGIVRDASGAAISGAIVTINDPAVGLTREVTTSTAGEFSAPGLYPGTYNIRIEAAGFKKTEASGFVLSAADKLSAGEFVLQVGAAAENGQRDCRRRTGSVAIQLGRTVRSDYRQAVERRRHEWAQRA